MSEQTLLTVLGWSTVINVGLLLWWLIALTVMHDWVYRLHSRWFAIERERFDAIHYAGMAFYKIIVLVFNLVPYLALRLAS